MSEISEQLLDLSKEIAENKTTDPHFSAVLAQIAFANQIFKAIVEVCDAGNGVAGEALLRTLFESIVSAAILAKHPEKLGDFVEHGRMTELRMMRVIEDPLLKKKLEHAIKATDAEFQKLWAKFNESRWHGLGTKDSFIEAEFEPSVYDRYYRRASVIAHGQPYVTARGGKVQARPIGWKNMSPGAANMAMLLMITLLAVVTREFKVGLEGRLNSLKQKIDAHLKRHMNAILKAVE